MAYIYVGVCVHVHVCMCILSSSQMYSMCVYVCIYMLSHDIYSVYTHTYIHTVYMCVYICVYVCIIPMVHNIAQLLGNCSHSVNIQRMVDVRCSLKKKINRFWWVPLFGWQKNRSESKKTSKFQVAWLSRWCISPVRLFLEVFLFAFFPLLSYFHPLFSAEFQVQGEDWPQWSILLPFFPWNLALYDPVVSVREKWRNTEFYFLLIWQIYYMCLSDEM